MNSTLQKQLYRTFVQMLADLKDNSEIEMFLNDFFSNEEISLFTKRLATTYWIKKGRDNENIKRNLSVNNRDISEANKLLKTKGVRLAIKKIEAEEWANVWAEKIKKISKR